MPLPQAFITHWKLNLFALLLMVIFSKLGFWQLARAHEKQVLLQTYAQRRHVTLSVSQLGQQQDPRFYRLRVRGKFDDAHTILLDNKVFHGQVGYNVYTPFHINGMRERLLVNRGFIPAGPDRRHLPVIKKVAGETILTGWLTATPTALTLGHWLDTSPEHFPIRVETILPNALVPLLAYPLYPYVLQIESSHPTAYRSDWQVTTMRPERHQAYALQWFALALCLLILSLILNFKQHKQ